jgi:hypothetical protein
MQHFTNQKEGGKQMKKFLILFLLLLLAAPAYAINIADNVDFGGDIRMRGYSLNNFFDFNSGSDIDDWEVFRLRTRIRTKVTFGENISGFIQIGNQTYGENIGEPETKQKNEDLNYLGFNFDNYEADNKSNKVFVDNAYMTVKNMFDTGITMQTGRMNLMYGSGFVLFDGQSQTASSSLYFDGIKLSATLCEKTVVDFLYFKDQENARWNVKEDDVTLMGAYLTSQCPALGGKQEFYILNKNDQRMSANTGFTPAVVETVKNTAGEDVKIVTESAHLDYRYFEKDLWMVGLRLSDKMENGLDYSLEGAYQFGDFDEEGNIDQDAFGGKFDGGFTFKDAPLAPRLFVGYAYMSGDDPETDEQERWDHFYGGWPQFGDLLAWKFVSTGYNRSLNNYDSLWREQSSTVEEAVYSNLEIASAGIGFNILKNLSAKLTYSMIMFEESDIMVKGSIVNKYDDFGDMYQLQLKYGYSKNLSFAFYGAMLEPGDAFEVSAYNADHNWQNVGDDDAYELFFETNLKF